MRLGRFKINPIDAMLAILLPCTAMGLYAEFNNNIPPLTVIEAARDGNAAMVIDHVDDDFDFTARDGWGRTLLHTAAMSGNESIVNHVLQNGGMESIRAYDNYGYTPVHLSLGIRTPYGESGDPTIMTFMKFGVDPNIETQFGEPLIVSAIERGDEALVFYLLEAGAELDEEYVQGQPLMVTLAKKSMWKVVERLLNEGHSPNVASGQVPPLAYAICESNLSAVRLLIDYGADVNAIFHAPRRRTAKYGYRPVPENPGAQALDLPATGRSLDLARWYHRSGRPTRPLDLAVWYDWECAAVLAEHGAKSDLIPPLLLHAVKH